MNQDKYAEMLIVSAKCGNYGKSPKMYICRMLYEGKCVSEVVFAEYLLPLNYTQLYRSGRELMIHRYLHSFVLPVIPV
jgi:hypothetical protein